MTTLPEFQNILDYSPVEGVFRWREDRGRVKKGDIAGYKKGEFVCIRIYGKNYMAHRLAWLYVHGEDPNKTIQHKDGNKSNNVISNIEFIGSSKFILRHRKASRLSVNLDKKSGDWYASVSLGRFKSEREAIAGKEKALKKLGIKYTK